MKVKKNKKIDYISFLVLCIKIFNNLGSNNQYMFYCQCEMSTRFNKVGRVTSYYSSLPALQKAYPGLYKIKESVLSVRYSEIAYHPGSYLLLVLSRCPYKADKAQIKGSLYDAYRFLKSIIPELHNIDVLASQTYNLALKSPKGYKVSLRGEGGGS